MIDHTAPSGFLITMLFWIIMFPTPGNSQIPGGFTPIFNGEDLTGWHISRTNHHGTTGHFQVEDGAIVMKQYPYGQGGILLTDENYGDFELYLEVKADPGTNGGIFFRSNESGSAYQVELEGDGRPNTGNLISEMLRTSVGAQADVDKVWNKGSWNAFRLRVVGEAPRVTLWVNGEKMWEARAERNDMIAGATEGMIALQLHWSRTPTPVPGGSCCAFSWKPDAAHSFRNIAIRER
ncbi:MAG: DUF1080 domain-containing protein [Balneolales bacterium]